MSFSPVPRFSFRSITDISPDFIAGLGIAFLMLDLDNTIAAYNERTLSGNVIQWAADMAASGVKMFIVSNSSRELRVETFAEVLNVSFIKAARKPSPEGLLYAMKAAGFSKNESALIGDQVYTDALAANRAGIISIVVRPRNLKNPLLALRYALESPFRAAVRKDTANQ